MFSMPPFSSKDVIVFRGCIEMDGQAFCVVDLDRKFADDPDGKALHELRSQLDRAATACRSALDAGVGPDDAKRLSSLLAAFGLGQNLLPVLWQVQQEKE